MVSEKPPYYTTFRRYVRRYMMEVTPELPLEMVQDLIRSRLNDKKHTIIESTWKDETGQPGNYFIQNRTIRVVSVRYVTGGMRHGLGPSTPELQSSVSAVEFSRAHNR